MGVDGVGPDLPAGVIAEVTPHVGDVVVFYHTGDMSPYHAGLPVVGDNVTKYVLRTDVMYEAAKAPRFPVPLSAPYDTSGYTYRSVVTGLVVVVDPNVKK